MILVKQEKPLNLLGLLSLKLQENSESSEKRSTKLN